MADEDGMAGDFRNLERRGEVWYAVKEIAPALRDAFGGQKRFKKSLRTRRLSDAQRRRHAVLAEWERQFERARRGDRMLARAEGLEAEAMALREAWDRHLQEGEDAALGGVEHELERQAERIGGVNGEQAARAFVSIAHGKATPLEVYLEDWLAESTYTERSKSDHRLAVQKRLGAWLTETGKPLTLEAVTDAVAGRFKAEALVGRGVDRGTANKYLSSLRQYWEWLGRSGYRSGPNPWSGKSLPKAKRTRDTKERPFLDGEVKRLLAGTRDPTLSDVMRLGALSGMRLEEIFQLRVRDCAGGVFDVGRSKTEAGERKVPIHKALKGLVARRSKGKAPDAFLIEEGDAAGRDGARSPTFSKSFTRYRKSLGIDDREDGQRRSRVNFHSWRRWFATQLEQAGTFPTLAARILGHEVPGMTYGLYSGGATEEQLVAAVNAVRLPAGSK